MAETSAASTQSGQAASSDVPPTGDDVSTTVDVASSEPSNQTEPVDDDPEIEFEEGLKLKRSEARDRLKRQKEFERAAHARFQEAAKLRKEATERDSKRQEQLEKLDLEQLLQERGINPDQWAEARLTKSLQRQNMTPEQVENEKLRQELESVKKQQKQTEETTKKERHETLTKQYLQHFDQLIAQTMTKFGKLPKTPQAVSKVAEVLTEYLDEEGRLQIDPSLAMEIAYENTRADTRGLLESIVDSNNPRVGEQLEELLGPKVVAAIQRRAIAKAQGTTQQAAPRKSQSRPINPATGQFLTMEEARKRAGMRI